MVVIESPYKSVVFTSACSAWSNPTLCKCLSKLNITSKSKLEVNLYLIVTFLD